MAWTSNKKNLICDGCNKIIMSTSRNTSLDFVQERHFCSRRCYYKSAKGSSGFLCDLGEKKEAKLAQLLDLLKKPHSLTEIKKELVDDCFSKAQASSLLTLAKRRRLVKGFQKEGYKFKVYQTNLNE